MFIAQNRPFNKVFAELENKQESQVVLLRIF